MIRLFLKKQKDIVHTEENGKQIRYKRQRQVLNRLSTKRNVAFVIVLTMLLSIGGSTHALAAGTGSSIITGEAALLSRDAFNFILMDKVSAGNAYPSMQGLAFGDGKAFVLKTDGKAGTQCILFGGEKTNLVEIKDKLMIGHGNDMTYRQQDEKLYVAPQKREENTKRAFIYRLATSGKMDAKIETKYVVGSIACWLNYDTKKGMDAFVLKDIEGLFHIVQINGTKLTELCQFHVDKRKGETLNQGICMYDGYLYVTYWESKSGNSYVYRVDKKMSTVLKESKAGTTKIYTKTRVVMLDKQLLSEALPKKPANFKRATKVEIESIAFTGGYLYFTANANYEDTAGKNHSVDGLYKIKKKLA